MKSSVVILTTSFAEFDRTPLDILGRSRYKVVRNTFGRKLNGDEVVKLCSECTGIIAGTERYDGAVLKRLPALRVISRCGAGIDNIDTQTANRLGIKIFSTPDAPTVAVAELTVGLILALLRNITIADHDIRDGIWIKKMGSLLSGKRVGIIGFGRIGQKVAERVLSFGASISYYDPLIRIRKSSKYRKTGLKQLLRTCDIITLHCSYSGKNRNLLGMSEFGIMKKDAILVNCSRGGIVDETALYRALVSKSLAGAALDVFEQEPYDGPLKKLKNVILTPHIGSYARESRIGMELAAVKNLIEGLSKAG